MNLEKNDQFQGVFDYLTEIGLNPVELSKEECQYLSTRKNITL